LRLRWTGCHSTEAAALTPNWARLVERILGTENWRLRSLVGMLGQRIVVPLRHVVQ
jgi:hypothetical protein